MTEIDQNEETMTQEEELDLLKEQAKLMGIKVSGNIGIDTLRERIRQKRESEDTSERLEETAKATPAATTPRYMRKSSAQMKLRQEQKKEQMKLVRVRVTCLNPLKAHLKGEIFTVANKYVGTVRKFVPFGEATDNGYHIPHILYEEMKSRKFNSVRTRKGPNGTLIPETRLVNEFAIEVLPQLTQKELDQLARAQMAANNE